MNLPMASSKAAFLCFYLFSTCKSPSLMYFKIGILLFLKEIVSFLAVVISITFQFILTISHFKIIFNFSFLSSFHFHILFAVRIIIILSRISILSSYLYSICTFSRDTLLEIIFWRMSRCRLILILSELSHIIN